MGLKMIDGVGSCRKRDCWMESIVLGNKERNGNQSLSWFWNLAWNGGGIWREANQRLVVYAKQVGETIRQG